MNEHSCKLSLHQHLLTVHQRQELRCPQVWGTFTTHSNSRLPFNKQKQRLQLLTCFPGPTRYRLCLPWLQGQVLWVQLLQGWTPLCQQTPSQLQTHPRVTTRQSNTACHLCPTSQFIVGGGHSPPKPGTGSPYITFVPVKTTSSGTALVPVCADRGCLNCIVAIRQAQLATNSSNCSHCTSSNRVKL